LGLIQSLCELKVLLRRESLPVQDVILIDADVSSIEVITLHHGGQRFLTVWQVLCAQVVSSLRVWHHHQLLDLAIKKFLIVYFLSEKNNSVCFQFLVFFPLNLLCVLVLAV
jgi:hypothetical protein